MVLLLSPLSLLLPVEVGCGRGRGWLLRLQTRHTCCNQSLLIIHPIKACSCHPFSAGLFTTIRISWRLAAQQHFLVSSRIIQPASTRPLQPPPAFTLINSVLHSTISLSVSASGSEPDFHLNS